MTMLPVVGQASLERRDAARNRERLLDAARALVAEVGVESMTMDQVADRAGVGKGTVFRRFGSREGLMAALLDDSERSWQHEVLRGAPPLGPGADPMTRLLAFGASRIEVNLTHARLIRAAGATGTRSVAAYSFAAMHVRMLLTQLRVGGDVVFLTTAVLAPLELLILDAQRGDERMDLARYRAGWDDLVRRIVAG